MTTFLFTLSFLIATFPVFIAVWVDRKYFAAVFQLESYKVALRELLFLSFAVCAFAILETLDASLSGKLSNWSHIVVVVIFFSFIVVMAFTMFRYSTISNRSVEELRAEQTMQVSLSWACAILSGIGAGFLKNIGG